MDYHWYPGHMTKARRQMAEDIKLIDLVIELVDARIPFSSRNPDIDELGKNKARLILLNKADMADPCLTKAWLKHYRNKGFHVLEINSKNGSGLKAINGVVNEVCREKRERDKRRGILNRPVRAMVVGIPNVGKSTFINAFVGKACTKTGNKPGVTKGKQWIRLQKNLELLDTPGILWPKFDDRSTGLRLAMIGSIKDDVIDVSALSLDIIRFLRDSYPGALEQRYAIPALTDEHSILTAICVSRHCYLRGEEYHLERAAGIVTDDFRNGRTGRVTLEAPEESSLHDCRRTAEGLPTDELPTDENKNTSNKNTSNKNTSNKNTSNKT